MLKEAIEKIVSLAAPTIREIEGSVFRITQDGDVSEIHPKPVYPSTLKLNSLDALVKMIRTEGAIHGFPLYITVPTHLSVRCFRGAVSKIFRCAVGSEPTLDLLLGDHFPAEKLAGDHQKYYDNDSIRSVSDAGKIKIAALRHADRRAAKEI